MMVLLLFTVINNFHGHGDIDEPKAEAWQKIIHNMTCDSMW